MEDICPSYAQSEMSIEMRRKKNQHNSNRCKALCVWSLAAELTTLLRDSKCCFVV